MRLKEELKKFLSDRLKENYPLNSYTTFGTGGPAEIIVFPEKREEIEMIFSTVERYKKEIIVLGKGSNVLISDEGIKGIVISTLNLKRITTKENQIICECGVLIPSLFKFCIENNLGGIEFMAGIPGTIGGAVISNAGLKKQWIGEKVEWVEVFNRKSKKFEIIERDKIDFSYRTSSLKNLFVVSVCIKLEKKQKEEIKEEIRKFLKERIEKQPIGEKSAGSIFKNPSDSYAGKLIEECGLKGYCIGDACISEKHANFIVNKGKAKSSEIYKLLCLTQKKVKEKFGIELEPEIEIIGKF